MAICAVTASASLQDFAHMLHELSDSTREYKGYVISGFLGTMLSVIDIVSCSCSQTSEGLKDKPLMGQTSERTNL
jgi:hypothetical protein